jgi:hypothetical protein
MRPILLTVGAVLMLTGCGGAHQMNAAHVSGPADAVPYSLYTHCGISEARIESSWYQADTPLSDGSGNPPAGWGNPTQQGWISRVSATEVLFKDSAGHRVRFVLHPETTAPTQTCS